MSPCRYVLHALLLSILAITLTGCGAASENAPNASPPPETPEATVPITPLRESDLISFAQWRPTDVLSVIGLVESSEDATLLAKVSGTVGQVLVSPGQQVQAGEVLIAYDRQNDLTQLQYLNALQNLTVLDTANNASIQSAQTALQTAQSSGQMQVQLASTQLSTTAATTEAAVASAAQALQTAKEALASTRQLQARQRDELQVSALTTAEQSLRSEERTYGWANSFLGVSGDYQNYKDIPKEEIGNANSPAESLLRHQAGDYAMRTVVLRPPTDASNPAVVQAYLTHRIARLEQLEAIIRDLELLIRQTPTNRNLSDTQKDNYVTTANGYRSDLQGFISSLKSTLESLISLPVQQQSELTSRENQVAQAATALAQAQAQAASQQENAQAQLANAQQNAENQAASASKSLENAMANATLQRSNAENQLRLLSVSQQDLTVTAPFSGTVQEVLVDAYQQISPGQQLLTLVNEDSAARLSASVTASQAAALQAAGMVEARTKSGVQFSVAVPFSLSSSVNPSTQRQAVELPVPSLPTGVQRGEVVDILIPLASENTVPVLPFTAVRFEPDGEEVLVLDPLTSTLQRQTITTGEAKGNTVEVLSGLEPGQQVIKYQNRYTALTPVQLTE